MHKVVEFKLVKGFDDYMVSSEGEVFSLKHGKKKLLKPKPARDGYLQVGLYTNGRKTRKYVHRLVAEAFIPNLKNSPQVNHKDEVKTNNCVENLEWCDAKYNLNFGDHNERSAKGRTNHPNMSHPVLCLETGEIFPSTHEASRQTGVSRGNISSCLNGKRKTAGGFHWQKFTE